MCKHFMVGVYVFHSFPKKHLKRVRKRRAAEATSSSKYASSLVRLFFCSKRRRPQAVVARHPSVVG